MSIILQFFKPYGKLLFFTMVFIALDVAGALYIPKLTAEMINVGVTTGDMEYIVQRGLFMLAAAVVAGIGTLAGTFLCAELSAFVSRDMREKIYQKSLDLSAADFKQTGTSSMIARTLNDVDFIGQGITYFIQMVLPVPFMCVMGIVMSFSIDKYIGTLLLGITAAILLSTFAVSAKASAVFERLQKFLDRLCSVVRENIIGVRVVRAFNKENHEESRMRKSFEDYAESAVKANIMFAGLDVMALVIVNFSISAIVWIGGNRVGGGLIEIGDITALTEYAVLILYYIIMAQMVIALVPRAAVCLRRIDEVLDKKSRISDGTESPSSLKTDEIIRFENVSFRYDNADEKALNKISFSCKRKETTAIIGSTGSGKSTIAELIMRFCDATEGRVLFKNKDVKNLKQNELREHISYVPQKTWLFSGTVAENLRYADSRSSEKRLRKALATAQAYFVGKLEDGIMAEVSQGGKNLSGGQKQRLAIARALVKKADLYIFDDSFSALDFKTDADLRRALAKEMKNSAVLITSQRVNTVMNAAQIIVLDNGKIVGKGTHKRLLKNCRVYREIVKSQAKGV